LLLLAYPPANAVAASQCSCCALLQLLLMSTAVTHRFGVTKGLSQSVTVNHSLSK
jgi:hypothetical protein